MKTLIFPFFLSLALVCIPIYYRITWNNPTIALGSDPQIKYYQIIQMHEKGLTKEALECIYLAKELGFSIENIPFGYPWAFIIHGKCFFQYPTTFSIVQYLLGGFWKTYHITFLPILFLFINFWLVFFIMKHFEYSNFISAILSFFTHSLTPIFLSSLDYSELTFTNFLACSYLYLLKEIKPNSVLHPLILGTILSVNFQTRPESTIGLVLFSFLYYIFSGNYSKNFYFFFYIAFSFLVVNGFFSSFYFLVYGNPFGLRGLNTLQDASSGLERNYFQDWKTDLFGSEFKIGLFQGFPVLLVFIGSITFIRHIQSAFTKALLASGTLFILILPILSPYRAGVDIFGMRYFETGVYLVILGFLLGCKEIIIRYPAKFPYLIIAVVLALSYFSYKSILRAIKHWSSGAKLSHDLYSEFQKIQPNLVVHKGLSTSYLLGITYLEFPQIAIFDKEEWKNVEQITSQKNLRKILFLEWKENKLFNKEIPTHIWESKFGIDFEIIPIKCNLVEKKKIIHFDAKIFDCN